MLTLFKPTRVNKTYQYYFTFHCTFLPGKYRYRVFGYRVLEFEVAKLHYNIYVDLLMLNITDFKKASCSAYKKLRYTIQMTNK